MSNLSLYINPNGGSGQVQELITVNSKIGGVTTVTPVGATVVTGLTNGSTVLTSPEMEDAQVEIFFGNIPIPDYDQGDGGIYYTKALSSDTITLSQALSTDDDIKIKIFGPIGTPSGGGGGSQDLQSVTDVGNTTTNSIIVQDSDVIVESTSDSNIYSGLSIVGTSGALELRAAGTSGRGIITANNLSSVNRDIELPDADGTLVLTVNGANADSEGNVIIAAGITDLTGDITASGSGSVAATLATVNGNVGSFGSATQSPVFTVNAKGLVTAVANTTITPAVGSITGLGSGVAAWLATPSSANLATALTNETGTAGSLVFSVSPTFTGTVIADIVTPTRVTYLHTAGATPQGASSINFDGNSTATTNGLSWGNNKLIYANGATQLTISTTVLNVPGFLAAGQIQGTGAGNTNMVFSSTTATISKTNADANTAVIFANTNASATGLIAAFSSSVSSTAMTVSREGKISFDSTVTTAGTTGNQTINKPSGTVNIAAAGTSITVTNSLVTVNSLIDVHLRTNDATATIKNCVASAGSFTVNLANAATAEVSIGFIVHN